jgi:hypothetical protein
MDSEDEGDGRTKYTWDGMGSADLGGKTRVLTIVVSVFPDLVFVVCVRY